ncbi:MAG TPA: hypothetical protein VFA81_04890 [Burkholderiales bacterium]|nr:hypothetical protein [Burkholderiales bacterium]
MDSVDLVYGVLQFALEVCVLVMIGIGASIQKLERWSYWWTRPHFRECRRGVVNAIRSIGHVAKSFLWPSDVPPPAPWKRGVATAVHAISMYFYAVTFAILAVGLVLAVAFGARPLTFLQFLGAMACMTILGLGWRMTSVEGYRARRELHVLAGNSFLNRNLW